MRSRRLRDSQDFWSGVLFVAFGLGALALSLGYPLGSAGRMGPGYFPSLLGTALVALGGIICLKAAKAEGNRLIPISSWPLVSVILAIAAFGLSMTFLGLVPAILVLIGIAALAGQDFRPLETAISAVVLTLFSVALFVWGLGLPFRLLGPG